MLGRGQGVLQRADHKVGAGEDGVRLGRSSAELLLVEPHHRVGKLRRLHPSLLGSGLLGHRRRVLVHRCVLSGLCVEWARERKETGEPGERCRQTSLTPGKVWPRRLNPGVAGTRPGRDVCLDTTMVAPLLRTLAGTRQRGGSCFGSARCAARSCSTEDNARHLASRWIPSAVRNHPTKEFNLMATHSATGADTRASRRRPQQGHAPSRDGDQAGVQDDRVLGDGGPGRRDPDRRQLDRVGRRRPRRLRRRQGVAVHHHPRLGLHDQPRPREVRQPRARTGPRAPNEERPDRSDAANGR